MPTENPPWEFKFPPWQFKIPPHYTGLGTLVERFAEKFLVILLAPGDPTMCSTLGPVTADADAAKLELNVNARVTSLLPPAMMFVYFVVKAVITLPGSRFTNGYVIDVPLQATNSLYLEKLYLNGFGLPKWYAINMVYKSTLNCF